MNSIRYKIEFPSDQINNDIFEYNRDLWYYVDTNLHNEIWYKTFEMVGKILESVYGNED